MQRLQRFSSRITPLLGQEWEHCVTNQVKVAKETNKNPPLDHASPPPNCPDCPLSFSLAYNCFVCFFGSVCSIFAFAFCLFCLVVAVANSGIFLKRTNFHTFLAYPLINRSNGATFSRECLRLVLVITITARFPSLYQTGNIILTSTPDRPSIPLEHHMIMEA